MDKNRLGIVRVLTTEDKKLLSAHGEIIKSYFPSLDVESRCIPDQYEGIHSDELEALAVPKVVRLGHQFADEGFDAVFISCAADPAVKILQKELSVPVVGAGTALAYTAAAYGLPAGVLGITDDTPSAISSVLGNQLVGSIRPEKIHSTLDLFRPEAVGELVGAALTLKKHGSRLIILACTGLATIKVAPVLRQETGLPVIDPLRAASSILWAALG